MKFAAIVQVLISPSYIYIVILALNRIITPVTTSYCCGALHVQLGRVKMPRGGQSTRVSLRYYDILTPGQFIGCSNHRLTPALSSLAGPRVVITTTSGAAGGARVGFVTTLGFQCSGTLSAV